jgi:hypothetical protein
LLHIVDEQDKSFISNQQYFNDWEDDFCMNFVGDFQGFTEEEGDQELEQQKYYNIENEEENLAHINQENILQIEGSILKDHHRVVESSRNLVYTPEFENESFFFTSQTIHHQNYEEDMLEINQNQSGSIGLPLYFLHNYISKEMLCEAYHLGDIECQSFGKKLK